MSNTVREVAFILLAALVLICVTVRDVRKESPNPDAARVRTLEAKVSRLQDELAFREFQTSSTILKGE